MSTKWDEFLVETPSSSKWDQYSSVPETETQVADEQTQKPLSQYRGGLYQLLTGQAETRPIETLISKRPSELLRRPLAGIIDLFESISPSAPSIGRLTGTETAPAEFVRGKDRQLTPEEEEAGQTLELLAQLAIPLAPKTGKAEQLIEKGIKGAEEGKLLKQVPKIAEREKAGRILKPKAFKPSIEKTSQNLIKESENIIQGMRKSKFPVIEQIEKGMPIEENTKAIFSKLASDSEKISGTVNTEPLREAIRETIGKFQKARIPAPTQQKAIDSANKMLAKLQAGDLSRSELLAQYRANNKAMKSLIETTLAQGSQPESLEVYQKANDAISKMIQSDPETSGLYKHLFKRANANWAELKRIDQLDSILGKIHEADGKLNPTKFANLFEKPKEVRKLAKIFGAEDTNKLKNLSKELKTATDAISKIKPADYKDALTVAPYLLKYLGIPGAKTIGTIAIGKKALELAYGHYLLKPEGQKLFKTFVNALKTKNPRIIKEAALKLDQSFKKTRKED